MRLAKALWPMFRGLKVRTSLALGEWMAWIDTESHSEPVCEDGPNGWAPTKAAAITELLTKLERLAEKREERLNAAIWAVTAAKAAREP